MSLHPFALFTVMADLKQAFALHLKIQLSYQHPPTLLFKGYIDKCLIVLQSVHTDLPHRGDGIISTLPFLTSAISPLFLRCTRLGCLCSKEGHCWVCRDWRMPGASRSLHNAVSGRKIATGSLGEPLCFRQTDCLICPGFSD